MTDAATPSPTPGTPRETSALDAFKESWTRARADFGAVVAPPAVALIAAGCLSIALNMVVITMFGGAALITGGLASGRIASSLAGVLAAVPTSVIAAFCLAAVSRFALRVIRGEKPGFGEVFDGASAFGPGLVVAGATVAVPTVVSAILSAVPFLGWIGSLAALAGGVVAPWCFAAVARGKAGPEALEAGLADAGRAPLTVLLLALLGGSGLLACCIGVLVTMPLMFLSVALVCARRAGEALELVNPQDAAHQG